MQPLVTQVALFTLAHSVSLAMMMLGWFAIPSAWVELAVALSIAFVAVENLCGEGLRRWRLAMVGLFGLIHGMAFAHSFHGMSADPSVLPLALTGFNLGLGLGQMAVIVAAFALVAPAWSQMWYRTRVAIPASCVIALGGITWAVDRVLSL